jgi:magnesium transporter
MAVNIYKEQDFDWIDIVEPSHTELLDIGKQYGLHYFSLLDSLDPDHLPKYEITNNTVFIIARIYDKSADRNADTIQQLTTKLAIFVGENFVITIHRPELQCLQAACKDALEGKSLGIFDFLCNVLKEVLLTFEPPGMGLSGQVDSYEAELFMRKNPPDILNELYKVKRQSALIKRVLLLSGNILKKIDEHIVDEKVQDPMLQDVIDLYTRIDIMYDHVVEDSNNLLNLYINLSSQKTNEVVRVLTVFSVFFMPLTFIVGIYGMNFKNMPELFWSWGYPAVMILMGLITVLILIWFKRKGWL